MTEQQTEQLTQLVTTFQKLTTSEKELEVKKKKLLGEIKFFQQQKADLQAKIIPLLGGLNAVKLDNGMKISLSQTKTLKLIKGTDLEKLPSEFVKFALDLKNVKLAHKENPFSVEFMEEQIKTKLIVK